MIHKIKNTLLFLDKITYSILPLFIRSNQNILQHLSQWCFTILLSYLRSSIAAADYVAEIEQLVKMVSLSKNLYIVYLYIIVKKEKKRKKRGENVRKRRKSYRRNTGQPRKQQPRINILILLKDHAKMSYIVKYMYVYILYVWRDYM